MHSERILVRCLDCSSCNYCFGCVGLYKTDFSILNQRYDRAAVFRADQTFEPRACQPTRMRAVVQRVLSARVEVDGKVVGAIGNGLLAYVGFGRDDTADDRRWVVSKIAGLRVFEGASKAADGSSKMTLSVADVGGAVLLVSQFTLYGDVQRGRRPAFDEAMPPRKHGLTKPPSSTCERRACASKRVSFAPT